jgi:glutamine cyclotransferase
MKNILYTILALFIISSCSQDKEKVSTPTNNTVANAKFVGIKNNDQFIMGNDVPVKVQIADMENISSLKVTFDDEIVFEGKPTSNQEIIPVKTAGGKVGFVNLKMVAEFNGQDKPTIDNRTIVLFSDKAPDLLIAKKVSEYPHEVSSYTQGLEFDGNQLFEGTGQRGSSVVAKVDLNTGKILKKADLDLTLFGEGITILGDKIYQLTWQAGRCMVYDKNSLEKINEFKYSGEGWGITNNGKDLIMTDGSSKIFFRNPETFEITKTLFVFDHGKEWPFLNELEWVEDKIYVNVYQKTDILIVDPSSGKVEAVIDAYDVDREAKSGNPKSDVLNGIAYNKETKSLYITGKYYPSLVKIEVTKN